MIYSYNIYWMVYFMENPLKIMDDLWWAIPWYPVFFGNLHKKPDKTKENHGIMVVNDG